MQQNLTIPNLLSLLRIAGVPFVIIAIIESRHLFALILFVVFGLTDLLDGWLARRYGWTSRLGAFLDPAGDKLLLAGVYVTLSFPMVPSVFHFPAALTVMIVCRDAAILLFAMLVLGLDGEQDFPPRLTGKLATMVLIGDAGLALLMNILPLPAWVGPGIIWSASLVTIVSGIDYVFAAAGQAGRIPVVEGKPSDQGSSSTSD